MGQEIKIIIPGSEIFGYQCPNCDWKCIKIGKPLKQAEKRCESCGATIRETTIGREERPKKQKKPTPNACKNCVYSRKGAFRIDGKDLPGCKCSQDGRTHSPEGICGRHKRRGIIIKQ